MNTLNKIKQTFLIILLCCFFFTILAQKSFAEGENDRLWKINSYERKVNKVGRRILEKNNINELITFRVPPKTSSKSQVNAQAEEMYAVITVERPLLRIIENDDELAAILSHEIVHIIYRHSTKHMAKNTVARVLVLPPLAACDMVMAFVGVPYPFFTHMGIVLTGGISDNTNQKYELDADTRSIDLMVKAGYNPLYMETILKRITSDGSKFNFLRSHPKGSIRIANVHEKIIADYPEFIEQKRRELECEEDAAAEKAENEKVTSQDELKPEKTYKRKKTKKN